MKIKLSIILPLILLAILVLGCSQKDNETPEESEGEQLEVSVNQSDNDDSENKEENKVEENMETPQTEDEIKIEIIQSLDFDENALEVDKVQYTIVNTENLNVRENPSTDADIVGRVHQDEIYVVDEVVLGDALHRWYKVEVQSEDEATSGYIIKNYCRDYYEIEALYKEKNLSIYDSIPFNDGILILAQTEADSTLEIMAYYESYGDLYRVAEVKNATNFDEILSQYTVEEFHDATGITIFNGHSFGNVSSYYDVESTEDYIFIEDNRDNQAIIPLHKAVDVSSLIQSGSGRLYFLDINSDNMKFTFIDVGMNASFDKFDNMSKDDTVYISTVDSESKLYTDNKEFFIYDSTYDGIRTYHHHDYEYDKENFDVKAEDSISTDESLMILNSGNVSNYNELIHVIDLIDDSYAEVQYNQSIVAYTRLNGQLIIRYRDKMKDGKEYIDHVKSFSINSSLDENSEGVLYEIQSETGLFYRSFGKNEKIYDEQVKAYGIVDNHIYYTDMNNILHYYNINTKESMTYNGSETISIVTDQGKIFIAQHSNGLMGIYEIRGKVKYLIRLIAPSSEVSSLNYFFYDGSNIYYGIGGKGQDYYLKVIEDKENQNNEIVYEDDLILVTLMNSFYGQNTQNMILKHQYRNEYELISEDMVIDFLTSNNDILIYTYKAADENGIRIINKVDLRLFFELTTPYEIVDVDISSGRATFVGDNQVLETVDMYTGDVWYRKKIQHFFGRNGEMVYYLSESGDFLKYDNSTGDIEEVSRTFNLDNFYIKHDKDNELSHVMWKDDNDSLVAVDFDTGLTTIIVNEVERIMTEINYESTDTVYFINRGSNVYCYYDEIIQKVERQDGFNIQDVFDLGDEYYHTIGSKIIYYDFEANSVNVYELEDNSIDTLETFDDSTRIMEVQVEMIDSNIIVRVLLEDREKEFWHIIQFN